MLSIIIPHYNSPLKLKRLLDSIPNDEDIEVIVVDDRSNKDLKTLEEVKVEYGKQNIRFFDNDEPNKGAGTCRNIGMSKANGQWYLFADADDYFVGDFYDKAKSYFSSNNDIVFFKPTSWDEVKNEISTRHITYSDLVLNFAKNKTSSSNILLLKYRFVTPCSKLIRAGFIKRENIKFDEVIASNDVMFSVKAGHYAKNIEVSKEVIYCVTKDKGTLTQNISIPVYRARLDTSINKFIFLRDRLSKKELKVLELRSIAYLITVVKYRMGFNEFKRTYKLLRRHKFPLITVSLLNPITIIKKISFHLKDLFLSKSRGT